MPIIKPDSFLSHLQTNPTMVIKVIIRTNENPKLHTEQVEELGLTVTGTTSLIKAIFAYGEASAVLTLAEQPWITSIEPDQVVKAV